MENFESFIGVDFWTALFVLLNTLAIFFVARKFLVGPVMKIVGDRQKEIDDLYAEANTARTEAEELRKEYRQKLDDAKATSDRLVKEAVARAQAREEEIVSSAKREGNAIREKAYQDVELEKKRARDELKGEISEIAVMLASKVTEREINAADHESLINGFLDEMGDAQ